MPASFTLVFSTNSPIVRGKQFDVLLARRVAAALNIPLQSDVSDTHQFPTLQANDGWVRQIGSSDGFWLQQKAPGIFSITGRYAESGSDPIHNRDHARFVRAEAALQNDPVLKDLFVAPAARKTTGRLIRPPAPQGASVAAQL